MQTLLRSIYNACMHVLELLALRRRRTWLTSLSQKGVSVFVLADMAGHRSIQTTQRYLTVNDEMKRNAAELI